MPASDNLDAPVPPTFCGCLTCLKKHPPGPYAGLRSTTFNGPGGYYGTRKWNAKGRGPMFYGMELELSTAGRRAWQTAFDGLGPVLAEVKPDGGLMEMTTHPLSLAFFMNSFPWELLGELSAVGATAVPRDGGLHVHVNKDGFTGASHMLTWWSLYYANPVQMTALGGRGRQWHFNPLNDLLPGMRQLAEEQADDAEYRRAVHAGIAAAQPCPAGLVLREPHKAAIRAAAAKMGQRARRIAVGQGGAIAVHRHPDTFEVRFPGASLRPGEVRTRVQLVAAGVEYTRKASDTSFAAFQKWVSPQWRYRDLAASMAAL